MKPAAPVTRMRTASLYAAGLQRLPDLLARALDLLRPVQMRHGLVAAAETDQGGAEVVLGVGLVQLPRPAQGRDSLLREPLGTRVVATRQRGCRLVGERRPGWRRSPCDRRRRRRWRWRWRWWRRWGWGRWWRRRWWRRRRRGVSRRRAALLTVAAREQRREAGSREHRRHDDSRDERDDRSPRTRKDPRHRRPGAEGAAELLHERRRGRKPVVRILRERALKDGVEMWRDGRDGRLHMSRGLGRRAFGLERPPPREQLVRDDPERIAVARR